MKKKLNIIKTGLLAIMFLLLPFHILNTYADNGPPTLLPAENTDLGGVRDACMNLSEKIKNGDIHLTEIPCFIKYFIQLLLSIGASLSVIFVMIGGYRYIISSEEDAKSAGKSTIMNALIGFGLSLSAWIIVDLVIRFITS